MLLLLSLLLSNGAWAEQTTLRDGSSVSVRGQLRPTEHTNLSAGIARHLMDITVSTGSSFEQNDVLVRFDCREEEADKDIVNARLAAATAELAVKEELRRLQSASGLEVELGKAEVAMAEAQLRKIDAVLDQCVIRAPFSGSVVAKSAQTYEYVEVGQALLEILNPASLEIEAVLPSTALSWISIGQQFSLQLDETGEQITAEVDRLVSEVDPVSQTLRIFGKIHNEAQGLLPGMSGRLVFEAR